MRGVSAWDYPTKYLAFSPSGELMQVWRIYNCANIPIKYMVDEDAVDFAQEQDNDNDHDQNNEPGDPEPDDNDDDGGNDHDGDDGNNDEGDDHDDPEIDDEDQDNSDGTTNKQLLIFKVDIGTQKLVELRDIGDHALFLGYNNAMFLPTKDFPAFKPNCAYLTHDSFDYKPTLPTDLGIWKLKERSMQKLRDAWPCMYSWLDLPTPIWITPRF
ncbi:hypothetical protein D1007_12753 [Hordeum vulgare]|nr:hypothetical protein D1007_12753 [Hordeum vulgare]